MNCSTADQNLLFGILAVQLDFVDRDQLIEAMHAWMLTRATPLGKVLVERGAISSERRALLDELVKEHLKQHDDDPQKSLASIGAIGNLRSDLEALDDAQLNGSLVHLSSAESERELLYAETIAVGGSTSTSERYRILRPHAKGGLGQVWVAKDTELHREVALKEIQQQHAYDEDSRCRFLLEAEVTGGLEHPGIVPVYGLGEYTDGRPYYVMRFIRGDSLRDAIARHHRQSDERRACRETTLQLRKLLARFIDVCDAIQYAHSRGVLHRDLKPGNIMLGKYGETLVVDWGLAKASGQGDGSADEGETAFRPASGSGSTPTQIGAAVGTPAYMPPEQAAGRLDQLGPPSDVYSLGATLYHLLTGVAPFHGDDAFAIIQKVQAGQFPRPHELRPDIPKPLESICLKAMCREIDHRYGSADELAQEIEHWLADEPVRAHQESWLERAGRFSRRHRAWTRAALTSLVLLTVAAIVAAALVDRERRRADRNARTARENAFAFQQQRDAARRAQRRAEAERERADENARMAAEQRDLTIETLQSLVYEVNDAMSDHEELTQLRETLLGVAIDGLQDVAESIDLFTFEAAQSAESLELTGEEYDEYVRGFVQGRQVTRDYFLAIAVRRLGQIFAATGRDEDALRELQRSLAILTALQHDNPGHKLLQQSKANTHESIAAVYVRMGDIEEGLDHRRAALDLRQQSAVDHAEDEMSWLGLSYAYSSMGEVYERIDQPIAAYDYFRRALLLRETKLGSQTHGDPASDLARCYGRLGRVWLQLGDPQQARHFFQQQLDLRQQLATSDPENRRAQRNLARAHGGLGQVLQALGQTEDARDEFARSLEIAKQLLDDEPRSLRAIRLLATSHDLAGVNYKHRGEIDLAREHLREAIRLMERDAAARPHATDTRNVLATAYVNLALLEWNSQSPVEACICAARALSIEGSLWLSGQHTQWGQALNGIEWSQAIPHLPELTHPYRRRAVRELTASSYALPDDERLAGELLVFRAHALLDRGEIDQAAEATSRLRAVASGHPSMHFDVARCYARCAATTRDPRLAESFLEQSVVALEAALNSGYPDIARVLTDPDLHAIRDEGDYQRLMRRLVGRSYVGEADAE